MSVTTTTRLMIVIVGASLSELEAISLRAAKLTEVGGSRSVRWPRIDGESVSNGRSFAYV